MLKSRVYHTRKVVWLSFEESYVNAWTCMYREKCLECVLSHSQREGTHENNTCYIACAYNVYMYVACMDMLDVQWIPSNPA